MEYKPPERKTSVAGISNPNDLSSLFASKPRAKKLPPVAMPTRASQSKSERSTRDNDRSTVQGDVTEQRVAKTDAGQQATIAAISAPSDEEQRIDQRLLESIKNLDAQLKAGRQQMKDLQAKALEQEQERNQMKADMKRDKEKLVTLQNTFVTNQAEITNLRREATIRLDSFNKDRCALESQIQTLGRDLAAEKEPRTQQQKRLVRSRDERATFDQEQRSTAARIRRAAVRKTYQSWREFFRAGAIDTMTYLGGRSYSRTYVSFNRRETEYWRAAARNFENHTTNATSQDDRKTWEIGVAARGKKLNEKEREEAAQREAEHLANRKKIYKKMTVYLEARMHRAEVDSREYLVETKKTEDSFVELKLISHNSRRLTKLVRHNLNMDGSPPIMETRSMFDAVLSRKAETMVGILEGKFETDLIRASWLRRAGVDPEQDRHLKHQVDAIAAIQDTLRLLRHFISRHNNIVKEDWRAKQPILHQAVWEKIDDVLYVQSQVRAKLSAISRGFTKYGLSAMHATLDQSEIMDVRSSIEEYQKIVFRNAVIREFHGRTDRREESRLQIAAKRKYEDATSRLRRSLRRTKNLGLHSCIYDMLLAAQREKDMSAELILEGHAASSLHQSKSDLSETAYVETDAPERFSMSQHTPNWRSERRKIKADKLEAERKLADARKAEANNTRTAEIDTTVTQNSSGQNNDRQNTESDTIVKQRPGGTIVAAKSTETAGSDGALATFSPTEETEDSVQPDLEDNAKEKVSPKPQPRWRAGRQASRSPTTYGFSPPSSSSSIRPRRGLFPKPEYKFSRLRFKPTPPRQSMHPVRFEEMSYSSWAPDTELPIRQPPSLTHDGSSIDYRSSIRPDDLSETELGATQYSTDLVRIAEYKETHQPLRYKISDQDRRDAWRASKTSGAAYWKYSLYKSPEGVKPRVHYCRKFQQAEDVAKLFLNQNVIGFDIEWEKGAKFGVNSIKENVSLVQIACEDRIALFHVAMFRGDEELMPPSLKQILEDPSILKVGVNIAGDFTRMRSCFGIQGQGLFELSHLYKVVQYSEKEPMKVDRKPAKLSEQVETLLRLPLAKGEVRTSAWSKVLSIEQTDYAANDAYAGFMLYDALEAKRKAMDPAPPRPALYELHLPLILGNGQPAPRAVKGKKKDSLADAPAIDPAAATDEQSLADEEAEPAAEQDDAQEEDGAEAQSDDEFYSCDSDIETEGIDLAEQKDATRHQQAGHNSNEQLRASKGRQESGPVASPVSPPLTPLAPPEIIKAEQWLAQWRAGLPADRAKRATPAYMRAYALWHAQTLELKQVAGLLRQPPLASSTVAMYVFDAVKQEDLPSERERLSEALRYVPSSAQWRYKSVISKLGRH